MRFTIQAFTLHLMWSLADATLLKQVSTNDTGPTSGLRDLIKRRFLEQNGSMTFFESAFGLGYAGSLALFITIICLSIFCLITAVVLVVVFVTRRNQKLNKHKSHEMRAAELFFLSDVVRHRNEEHKRNEHKIQGQSGSKLLGASDYCLSPHDVFIQQHTAASKRAVETLGCDNTEWLLKVIDRICAKGFKSNKNEHTGRQMATFVPIPRYSPIELAYMHLKLKAVDLNLRHHSQSVVCNLPVPRQEMSYCEMRVVDMPSLSVLVIGLSPPLYPCYSLPGSQLGSIGYYSNDGTLYQEDTPLAAEGGTAYGKDDVIGILVKRSADLSICYFYLNGEVQGFAPLPKKWDHPHFVCVGARGGKIKVELNFGSSNYYFPPNASGTDMRFGEAPIIERTAFLRAVQSSIPSLNSIQSPTYASLSPIASGLMASQPNYHIPARGGFVGTMGLATGDFTPIQNSSECSTPHDKFTVRGGRDKSVEHSHSSHSGSSAESSVASTTTGSPDGMGQQNPHPHFNGTQLKAAYNADASSTVELGVIAHTSFDD